MSDQGPDLLTVKAAEGGLIFHHPSFVHAVLSNLKTAMKDPHIWPYVEKKNLFKLAQILQNQK